MSVGVEDICVVAALKSYWVKVGIPRMSDQSISKIFLKVFEDWKQLCRKKNQTSSVEVKKREAFEKKLDQLFDIAHPNAIQILQSDRLRTAEAKQADVDFYLDQKGPRVGYMEGLDVVHKEAVEKKKNKLRLKLCQAQVQLKLS